MQVKFYEIAYHKNKSPINKNIYIYIFFVAHYKPSIFCLSPLQPSSVFQKKKENNAEKAPKSKSITNTCIILTIISSSLLFGLAWQAQVHNPSQHK